MIQYLFEIFCSSLNSKLVGPLVLCFCPHFRKDLETNFLKRTITVAYIGCCEKGNTALTRLLSSEKISKQKKKVISKEVNISRVNGKDQFTFQQSDVASFF